MNLKNHKQKKPDKERRPPCEIPCVEVQEQEKRLVIQVETKVAPEGRKSAGRGHRRTLWGEGNVLCLERGIR